MQFPKQFIIQIEQMFPGEAAALLQALDSDPSVAIRLNRAKCGSAPPRGMLRVPWCSRGYYLTERPQFTFDPAFHAGRYYVQDASSMIISHIISGLVATPVRYLDLCAAPGGKSTAAIDALPHGSLMVCNEIMPARARILKENIIKWGNPRSIVTCSDSATVAHLYEYFDVIAADVPCSGEGMFRKDAEAVAQWSPSLVSQCAARQREIVDNAWQALRPGGLFIYSTCTFNRCEDEDMVRYIINAHGADTVNLDIPDEWQVHPALDDHMHAYRFLPHLTRGEGLFVCVLRKPLAPGAAESRKLRVPKRAKTKPQQVPSLARTWIDCPDSFSFSTDGESVTAFPVDLADDLELLSGALRVIAHGCRIADMKGKDLIPTQDLALCSALCSDSFASCELDYNAAIAYLRGEAIVIDAPRGMVLLTYGNLPIGFAKNLGSRANNLYPKEWRVKSTHVPVEPPAIL